MKKISFKKIKNIFHRKSSVEKKPLFSPRRDWLIISVTFFVLLVLTIIGHSMLYILASRGSVFTESAEEEVLRASLKRTTIEEVVTRFENKKLNTENFNSSRPILSDPS